MLETWPVCWPFTQRRGHSGAQKGSPYAGVESRTAGTNRQQCRAACRTTTAIIAIICQSDRSYLRSVNAVGIDARICLHGVVPAFDDLRIRRNGGQIRGIVRPPGPLRAHVRSVERFSQLAYSRTLFVHFVFHQQPTLPHKLLWCSMKQLNLPRNE